MSVTVPDRTPHHRPMERVIIIEAQNTADNAAHNSQHTGNEDRDQERVDFEPGNYGVGNDDYDTVHDEAEESQCQNHQRERLSHDERPDHCMQRADYEHSDNTGSERLHLNGCQPGS